ncbi:MAG: AI-2E family transporter [Clostridia bacterium]
MNTPRPNGKFQIALTSLIVIFLCIVFYFLAANVSRVIGILKLINSILRPFYYGAILTFLLIPIHGFFSKNIKNLCAKKKINIKPSTINSLAVLFSMLTAFLCVYLLLSMVLPQIYNSINNFILSFPEEIILTTPLWLENIFEAYPSINQDILNHLDTAVNSFNIWINDQIIPALTSVEGMFDLLKSRLLPNLSNLVTGVSQWFIALFIFAKDIIIAIIVAVYLLSKKDLFLSQIKKLTFAILPEKCAKFVLEEIHNAYIILNGFINGKLLDSLIVGAICFVACVIFNFPYAPLVATIIGVTNIIPYFGPFIGAIPCAILILTVSPVKFIYFIIFIIILQQFDGNILGPKILGQSIGVASFWVLFSVMFFGGLFGFAGMVLGVPIFATFYSMLSRLVKYLLEKKGLPTETESYSVDLSNLRSNKKK